MYLNETEVKRFYTIWFQLLHFVNLKKKLAPSFPKSPHKSPVTPDVVFPIRNALWEDDTLRTAFIADNPAKLSQDDLALVESWQHRVAGNFFIFRHLKKHTIFIDGSSPAKAYGVLGITNSIEDMISPYLPVYVQAVLIPFEDRIIYDSLISPYPIHFGSGYKRDLKDTYNAIEERAGIITTLPFKAENDPSKVQASNKKVLVAFQKSLGAAGLSPKMIQEHTTNITAFTNDYLSKKLPPTMLLDFTEGDLEGYQTFRKGKLNWVSFKRFVWFLRDTGRLDWDEAENLLKFFKSP